MDRAGRPSLARLAFQRIALPATIVLLLSTIAWANVRATTILEYHQVGGVRCTPEMSEQDPCHPAGAGLGEVLLLGAMLTVAGLVMSAFVPVNRFSLHGMYRERLVRTFLGASRGDRHPNRFTGFDANDDLCVHDLAAVRPLHVINTTLNAVRATEVGRHEISAQSFTFTPLHVGNHALGYRAASQYGSDGGGKGTGLSLGMALAVSGAAASPAMGIYSTKARAFLLTLANARLGLWFGNPASDSDLAEQRAAARRRAAIARAAGTDDRGEPLRVPVGRRTLREPRASGRWWRAAAGSSWSPTRGAIPITGSTTCRMPSGGSGWTSASRSSSSPSTSRAPARDKPIRTRHSESSVIRWWMGLPRPTASSSI